MAKDANTSRAESAAASLPVWDLFHDIWRGKSILRSLSDRALDRHVRLHGTTLDIGGGASAYLQQFPSDDRVKRIVMDLQVAAHPTVVATAEAALPFRTSAIDTVLLHNVIEHVYGYQQLLQEVWRILTPGGRAYISVPFLVPLHEWTGVDGYRDYHRLSGSTLRRLLANFSEVRVEAIEVGPFLAAGHVAFSAVPIAALRVMLAACGQLADRFYSRLRTRRDANTQISFVLGYVAVLTK